MGLINQTEYNGLVGGLGKFFDIFSKITDGDLSNDELRFVFVTQIIIWP